MNKNFRIIDANINRASEGLRLIEEYFRFIVGNEKLSKKFKTLRHQVRKNISDMSLKLLNERNASNDIGLKISLKTNLDEKNNYKDLILANFKRVEESLRVLEESFKIEKENVISKTYEKLRFEVYDLEKEILPYFRKNFFFEGIYAISGEDFSLGRNNIEVAKEILKAGVKIYQYREKEKKMLYKYNEAKEIQKLCKDYNALFIINDDIHLAMLLKADGIHIGQEDLPIKEVRKLLGENMIIGLSTHSPKEAKLAVLNGADYIGVGPIFKTKTKKDVIAPVGLKYLDFVVQNIKIPFVAIGGIKENNVKELAKRGAKTFAMITEIVGAKDIGKKIKSIKNQLTINN